MFDQATLFCTAVAVEDLSSAVALFTKVLGFSAPTSGPLKGGASASHKVNFTFLEKGGRFIELVQPNAGPRLEMLKRRGPGPYMLDFTVSDIVGAAAHFHDFGIERLNPSGEPLQPGSFHKTATGVRSFYVYVAGIYIEVQEPH